MQIGTKSVSTYRQTADEVVYAGSLNSVSITDTVSLRRTLPEKKGSDAGTLRGNMNFARSFAVGDGQKLVVVNVTAHVPVGVDATTVRTWMTNEVFPGATSTVALDLATKGDIHLQD